MSHYSLDRRHYIHEYLPGSIRTARRAAGSELPVEGGEGGIVGVRGQAEGAGSGRGRRGLTPSQLQ